MKYKNIKKLLKKAKLMQKYLMNKLMIQQIEFQSLHIILLKQLQEHQFIKTLKHIQVKAKSIPNLFETINNIKGLKIGKYLSKVINSKYTSKEGIQRYLSNYFLIL